MAAKEVLSAQRPHRREKQIRTTLVTTVISETSLRLKPSSWI